MDVPVEEDLEVERLCSNVGDHMPAVFEALHSSDQITLLASALVL